LADRGQPITENGAEQMKVEPKFGKLRMIVSQKNPDEVKSLLSDRSINYEKWREASGGKCPV
jgi:hypothetical protein